MQLTNSYYYFKSAIPKETCQRIIDRGLERIEEEKQLGNSVEAYTFGDQEKSAVLENAPNAVSQAEATKQTLKKDGMLGNSYVRDSKATWLNESWIYELVMPYIQEANSAAGWNWDIDFQEAFQFTIYDKEGFYGWHKDGGSDHQAAYKRYIHGITQEPLRKNGRLPHNYVTDTNMVGKVRKISLTLQLNDPAEYEGGNLKFDFGHHSEGEQFHECTEIRDQGSIIVFPSFVDHCVTPIISGTRYSLVLWTLGRPFR